VLSLHSSNEPGELSQWLCRDDSTINIISVTIIIIIIIGPTNQRLSELRKGRTLTIYGTFSVALVIEEYIIDKVLQSWFFVIRTAVYSRLQSNNGPLD